MKTSVIVPLLLAAYTSAHGFVRRVTIDGETFNGNIPSGASNPSIIRQISDPSPVKGADNPAVNCGPSASTADEIADANPGSVISFDWEGGDGSNWPHNTGPMMTYMASCGETPCSEFDSSDAEWFKIQQVGRKADGEWAQADLMNGAVAKVTLPDTLAPGNYLIRHEILSLHLGTSVGGAEFYPSCAQIRVGGDQTGQPEPDELVRLPGAYSDNDPGIVVPDVFNAKAPYDFPGPAIAKFVGGAESDSDSTSSGSGTGSGGSTSGSSNDETSGSSSSGACRLRNASTTASGAAATGSSYRPRHISRVMRDLVLGHARNSN